MGKLETVGLSDHIDGVRQRNVVTSEASTLTELCASDDLPEVELVSLLSEQLPTYKLRADALTNFGGYRHSDFVQFPALQLSEEEEEGLKHLSGEQILRTLEYFGKYTNLTVKPSILFAALRLSSLP